MALADFFLVMGAVILIGFAGSLIRQRSKIPESLFLILFGLLIGPVTGLVPGETLLEFAPIISVVAMVVILVESGIGFDMFRILKSFGKAAILTLLIAIITTILITAFLVIFYSWELSHAALLGIISSGTTTITAMSLMGAVDVPNKIRRLILLETIINDFTLIVGAFIIVEFIKYASFSIEDAGKLLLSELSVGVLVGVVFGFIWRYVLEELNLERKLNYASTIGLCFFIYYVASVAGGNPIITIFAFSLFLGNYYKIHTFIVSSAEAEGSDFKKILNSIRSVQTDFTFFVKSFFFVLLGITFDISVLYMISPFLIGGIVLLIIIARIISSTLVARIDREIAEHRTLISFMIPRGYVAAVLAFIPSQEGIEIPLLTDIIVILIVVTTLIAIFGTIVYTRTRKTKGKMQRKRTIRL